MATNLPKIGVRAVAEGADNYLKQMSQIEKATTQASKSIEKTAGSSNAFSKAFSKIGDSFGGANGKISEFASKVTGAQANLSGLFTQLPAGQIALAGVAAGAVAAAAAFVALGLRGADLTGLADSFDRLTASVNIAGDALLTRLNEASRGAVSNADLIRSANIALSGSFGEFGNFFGESLPQLLEIARAQANATGQDITFLFNSLVTGIKRGSPLLIDNTGLTINITEANERYAESIGKTVGQLTAQERNIALLQATLEAGNRAISAFGGQAETAADKLARLNAGLSNIADTAAIAVQPAFELLLDGTNRIIAAGLVFVTNFVAPVLTAITNIAAALIGPVLESFAVFIETLNANIAAIGTFLSPIANFISAIVEIVQLGIASLSRVFAPIARAFAGIQNAIGRVVNNIVKFLAEWVGIDLGVNFDQLIPQMARGAGMAFAAFGNAIIQVANDLIFPAVIQIATFIADFLVGASPPPKGPLSKIDKGGANTMLAFLDGMLGVSLAPVEQVAADVNAVLGDIGKATLDQVQARFAQLDAALQPFADQLAIVKANFESIANPAKAALDAIDRQLEKAVGALASGASGSAEAVRALDAQRDAIEGALDAQQNLVDAAQIQFALAQSQQGEERALLSIQEARLKTMEEVASASEAAAGATEASARAAGGAGAGSAAKAAGGTGGAGAGTEAIEDIPTLGGMTAGSAISQVAGGTQSNVGTQFGAGFNSTIDKTGLKSLERNAGTLQKQLNRISGADIGARISEQFGNIGTAIQERLGEASAFLSDFIGSVTDPNREGSLPYAFNNLPAVVETAFTDLGARLGTGLANALNQLVDFATTAGDPNTEGSIAHFFSTLPATIEDASASVSTALQPIVDNLSTAFADISADVTTAVSNAFDANTEGSFLNRLNELGAALPDIASTVVEAFRVNFIDTLDADTVAWLDRTFNPETEGSILWQFVTLPERMGSALAGIGQVFTDYVVTPVQDAVATVATNIATFFSGEGEGSLRWIINQGVQSFIEFPGRIVDALTSLAVSFFNLVAIPIIGGINAILQGLEDLVNNALISLANLFSQIEGVAEAVGQGDAVRGMIASLSGGISLPRVPYPPLPTAQTAPGAKLGGIFTGGTIQTHSNELITSAATKTAVFPANVTKSLDILATVLPQAISIALQGYNGNNTSNNDNSMNVTFNGVSDSQGIMQRLATMRALG